MLEWVYRTAERVDALAKSDPEYQELENQRRGLEGSYNELLDRLGESDRELFLEYMDVVGNMQYRMTQLAWYYGKNVFK